MRFWLSKADNQVVLISVIIPTLNEATRIEACLGQFEQQPGDWELIVADGGSGDDTISIVRARGVLLICAASGRGPQMNAAAAAAQGSALLFLHADATLPPGAHRLMSETLADSGTMLGCFRVRHEAERWQGSWKSRLLRFADLRSHYTRRPYGDQGLFVRRLDFENTGGFPHQPLMEELDLANQLNRWGRIVTLRAEIRASSRRFEANLLRAVFCMSFFPMLHRLGVSPRALIKLYGHPR